MSVLKRLVSATGGTCPTRTAVAMVASASDSDRESSWMYSTSGSVVAVVLVAVDWRESIVTAAAAPTARAARIAAIRAAHRRVGVLNVSPDRFTARLAVAGAY